MKGNNIMCPVNMGVDPEKVKAPKPAPAGWYKLKLKGFKPKMSGKKDSVNLNAQFEIVEARDHELNGKPVFMTMSQKFARQWADVSHGLGFALQPSGELPGSFVPDDKDVDNVEKYQYKGPLLGKTMEAELVITTYQGNEKNEVKQIKCALDGCAVKFPEIKHSTNMISNK